MSQTPRKIKRGRDTKIPQSSGPPEKFGDEAVYKELGDRMERAATTASSLEAEQDSGNINRTQSMATLNEPINTLGIGEDSMKLMELMEHYTKLSELKMFWHNAFASTLRLEVMEITATIDGKVKVFSEASIRRHLKLEDSDGKFSPQWRFLDSYNLQCFVLSKTAWEQFSAYSNCYHLLGHK
ncbi:hypothetical protein Tco_0932391 [Tanacetum coccineum]